MRYFTIEELEHSDTATKYKIDNTTNGETRTNLTKLIELLLDPIRTKWGKPIKVNSGYRCSKLNRIVGGVSTSQHVLGEAADITVGSSEENKKLFEMILSMNILFDQLILEDGGKWIHISLKWKVMSKNRREVLLGIRNSKGKMYYTKYQKDK
jgi:hypothetical protein